MPDLTGKTAIVTGAAMGIGRDTAITLAHAGCAVMVADIEEQQGQQTVGDIEAMGGKAAFTACDVGDEASVIQLIDATLKTFGRLDIAVNNAGVESSATPLYQRELAEWEANIKVNLTGVFLCMKHQIAHMREHGGGAIVNISSMAARKIVPNAQPYVAAKNAVLSLTACAAIENGDCNVRVNSVLPGLIATRMLEEASDIMTDAVNQMIAITPLGRIGETADIANTVAWLVSEEAKFITGQHISVDGGVTT